MTLFLCKIKYKKHVDNMATDMLNYKYNQEQLSLLIIHKRENIK